MDARWTEYKIKEEISISDSMKNLGYINSLYAFIYYFTEKKYLSFKIDVKIRLGNWKFNSILKDCTYLIWKKISSPLSFL